MIDLESLLYFIGKTYRGIQDSSAPEYELYQSTNTVTIPSNVETKVGEFYSVIGGRLNINATSTIIRFDQLSINVYDDSNNLIDLNNVQPHTHYVVKMQYTPYDTSITSFTTGFRVTARVQAGGSDTLFIIGKTDTE